MMAMIQIADTQNLIGPAQPIEELVEEYAKEDQVYRHKLQVTLQEFKTHLFYVVYFKCLKITSSYTTAFFCLFSFHLSEVPFL